MKSTILNREVKNRFTHTKPASSGFTVNFNPLYLGQFPQNLATPVGAEFVVKHLPFPASPILTLAVSVDYPAFLTLTLGVSAELVLK